MRIDKESFKKADFFIDGFNEVMRLEDPRFDPTKPYGGVRMRTMVAVMVQMFTEEISYLRIYINERLQQIEFKNNDV